MKMAPILLKAMMAALPLLLVYSAAQAADTNKGRQLFDTNCAICHGQTGRSVMPGAPNFGRGEGVMRSDSTLLNSIRNGKNACPSFRGLLADRDIMDVIAYLRTFH